MSFLSKSKTNSRKGFLVAAGIVAGSLFMTSCMDDIESPELPPVAYVSIFQGAVDAPAMDVFANQNRVNQDPLQYSQIIPYSPFQPGSRDFRFSAYNSATALLEKNLVLKADSVYSLFVAKKVEGIDAILVKDVWEDPTAENAQLRFVHLSPDTEAVSLEISGTTTPLVAEAAFRSVSEFATVGKGNFTLTVKSKASGETVIQTGTLELKGNRVYTLILRGLAAEDTGTKKLDMQLVTNYISY